MNRLKINEEQKLRFEEMFEFFFPEFKENLKDGKPVQFLHNDDIRIYDFRDKTNPKLIEMSWLEFCFTYLQRKLDDLWCKKNNYKPPGYNLTIEDFQRPFFGLWSRFNSGECKIHPVDYLYNLFINLK